MRQTFQEAVVTVTGSRTLVELAGERLLVDSGRAQGTREHRLPSRKPFDADDAARCLEALRGLPYDTPVVDGGEDSLHRLRRDGRIPWVPI